MQELSPIGWALRPLKRYAEFSGRSSRAELWWFVLGFFVFWIAAVILLFGVLAGLGASHGAPSAGIVGAFGIIWLLFVIGSLALLVPWLAVQVRRLHDIDRSGWWLGGFYLLYLIYAVLMGSVMFGMVAAMKAGNAPPDPAAFGAGFGIVGLLGLLQFVYMIVLIVFYCLPGTAGPNRFGPDPYGRDQFDKIFA
jgi:uncharacterized membrane protein YhaH (DUF805 family)